jgi:hypothetical protein
MERYEYDVKVYPKEEIEFTQERPKYEENLYLK